MTAFGSVTSFSQSASGASRVNSTVLSSIFFAPDTVWAVPAMTSLAPTRVSHDVFLKRPGLHFIDSLIVQITSSAVNGSPSCHFTPWRSLKVYTFASGVVHDSARSPVKSTVFSSFQTWSTRLLNMSSKLTAWLNVS
jgi:hypothetical protein